MKKMRYVFLLLAILLSDVMCAVTAFRYRAMLCGIAHGGYSAPAGAVFLSVIPYGVGIAICLLAAHALRRREERDRDGR